MSPVTLISATATAAAAIALLLASVSRIHAKLDPNPDIELKTDELARKYGYPFEEHTVITDDGYILALHRIPFGRNDYDGYYPRRRSAVLLMHGLGGSSADWVLMGPGNSLAYILADSGYDVWLGNNRGNIYSRNHTSMIPTDRYFWDFSYHEMGMFDLPASIDYILGATGRRSLLYVGHSQGTSQFFVMASSKPEYNGKVALAAGLAPAAFTGYLRGPITQLTKLTYFGVWVGENFGYPEFGSRSRWGRFISRLLCQSAAPTQIFCSTKFYLLAGFSPDIDLDKLTVIVGHIPAGASWKQLIHYGQGYINPGYFRAFDYADRRKNTLMYGSPIPPEYKLSAITAPLALFSSNNDWLATPKDVELLSNKLRSVVFHKKVTENRFNHYDFLWGRTAPQIVFEPLLRLMEKYRYVR
ncbi:lipase 3-like [Trichogramma pretiosum]|uniref:lipase 3-like n=1 Tax=Trichogramma pretiosum TaxID=7493 RepID=UPI0006C9DCFD|nr:lipase 3-like [Trichogramma pretiosum]